ncbi:hypothetical protein N7471_007799 [Penicillium samsonianum]|uniref:uncharacterized protein n=1 Tax=Penicillium samsonianum TaxID=1882272 RepID=UPI0025489846|nr:uncharacterized protein N7471_007799 [Penicillium samsonianum]KAJ6132584.1 hypothetical protein N7471_007799 [Penicillium samsonianum]
MSVRSISTRQSGKRSAHGNASSPSTRSFRGGHEPKPTDVFIAVMGVTGSGKSSFISLCSGKSVQIGHTLDACTAKVDVYAYKASPDRTVYLIDTPGFDDTSKNDTEILSEIATWLGASYRSKILLHGIIYLHRITDVRMQGSARRNIQTFRDLCGEDALKKVILVTTMWDKVQSSEGDMREKQLKDTKDFWGWMLSKGSTCHRHDNTETTARDIVHRLAKQKNPIITDIQKQLVDQNLQLDQTAAGKGIQSETLKERAKWMKEQQKFEKERREAMRQKDREKEEIMREERDMSAAMIRKANQDMEAMRLNMEELVAQREEREALLEKRIEERLEKQMQKKQAAHDKEIKRIQREKEAEMKKSREQEKQAQRDRKKLEEKRRAEQQRKAEQERISEQERKAKAAEANRQSQNSSSKVQGWSPYSVTIGDHSCAVSGPRYYKASMDGWPKVQAGSEWIGAVSFGSSGAWIARYGGGTWKYSLPNYPILAGKLAHHGVKNLEFCVLGPGQTYYARWVNGVWWSQASEQINNYLTEIANRLDGSKVLAMAVGYNDTYVISFGWATGSTIRGSSGHRKDLKGYYSDLNQFANASSPLDIVVSLPNCLNQISEISLYNRPLHLTRTARQIIY